MKRKILVMVALGLIMSFCLIFDTNITGEFMNKSRPREIKVRPDLELLETITETKDLITVNIPYGPQNKIIRDTIADPKVNKTNTAYIECEANGISIKPYREYTALAASNMSNTIKLQQQCDTTKQGLRKYENRYIIALGSGYTHQIGQYVDLELANGTIIPCMVGDWILDKYSTDNHKAGWYGETAKFLVDETRINPESKANNNMSYTFPEWDSEVVKVIIYCRNLFNDELYNNPKSEI